MICSVLNENPTLKEIEEFFKEDHFATRAANCVIVEGRKGHSVVEMPLERVHLNAMGAVMGGAIFTLADFAIAIASNIDQPPTVSVSNTVQFISAAKGSKLIATCDADKTGRTMGFYTVDVTDDTGRLIAKVTGTSSRVG